METLVHQARLVDQVVVARLNRDTHQLVVAQAVKVMQAVREWYWEIRAQAAVAVLGLSVVVVLHPLVVMAAQASRHRSPVHP